MVIGQLQHDPGAGNWAPGSAWAQVEAAQRDVRLPCLLIPQPAHAVVAGELAAGLTCFGFLPPDIKRAIQMHDTGWASSDAEQIQRLRSAGRQASHAAPVSFLAIPPGEVEEAWTDSIDTVGAFSRAGAMVVSRHFCLLAEHDPAHQRFLQAERARSRKREGATQEADLPKDDVPPKGDELARWTAALGFCDLVSLYLLSGLSRPVEFPLAHPASPQAQTAPRVKMQVAGKNLVFTPGIARAGCVLSVHALTHPLPAQGPRAETLTWEVQ